MSTIVGNLLPAVLVLLYINVGLVNAEDNLPALMWQIGDEYVAKVEPCRIIRNAYNNYEDEIKDFRKSQQKCTGRYKEACEFLMKSIFEENEEEFRGKQRFITRVYYFLRNAVGDTPFGQLAPMHILDGLVTLAESGNNKKAKPATAVCQHWSTLADLRRGDKDRYQFGIYEASVTAYNPADMEKVTHTLRPATRQASYSGQPGAQ